MKSTIDINYKLPVNFQPEWAHLFKPDYNYKTVDLKVRELQNVFVNHYGLVIKNGLLVKGCTPNIGFSNYDDGFYYKHWRKATEQMLVCKFGKSIPSLRIDDNNKYLVIHSPWFSYYFWLTECLPRLLMVKKQLPELILLYPSVWEKFSFVNQTLELFPELNKMIIPSDYHLFVKNLIMPEVKPWTPMFIPEPVFAVRNLLLKEVEKRCLKSSFGNNIYISRKNAARKKFVDETTAENTLRQFGFDTVIMEDFSFFEQIAIMKNARYVFAITGAGTINVMFMQQNGHLFDIPHRDYITRPQYKFHFYKLCQILNIDYSVLFHDRVDDPAVDHYSKQNLIFDVSRVTEYLKQHIKQ
ncbi:MAG TPA: glycosyltransferase family 61 protein [Bacteroidales bacterium]|nr:glycosyltransferase family 61 protein [Bacteroidales bacterium]